MWAFPGEIAIAETPGTTKPTEIDWISIHSSLYEDEEHADYLGWVEENYNAHRYSDSRDLVRQLEQAAMNGCIKTVEISGHGRPSAIEGIFPSKKEDFCLPAPKTSVRHFYRLEGLFCDDCVIYLNGCNTGLGKDNKDIAQELADITGCTVYGACGYLSGDHFAGNEKCTREYTPDPSHYAIFDGSVDAEGDACWKEFKPKKE